MGCVECKKRNIESIDADYIKALGYSIIDNCMGEIVDQTGNKPQTKLYFEPNEDALLNCTDRLDIDRHIDILAEKADIIYDLGYEAKIETIVLRAYFSRNPNVNYTIGEFKLYAANTKAELFDDNNEIAHECSVDNLVPGNRNNADWVYDVNGAFRYFGIKILNPNPTDDIIRLCYIGLYNKEYTEKKEYVLNNFGESLIHNVEPTCITDGNLFVDELMYEINGSKSFKFPLDESRQLSNLWVVTVGSVNVKAKGFKLDSTEELPYGRKQHNFVCLSKKEVENLNVTFKGNGFVDGIGVNSKNFKFSVKTNDVICDDFYGIGANVIPTSFMPESLESGYNEVYWALERERIIKAKPNVVRVWFQPDWVVYNYDDYKNGNYDFECQKMQSVYKWFDALKEAGTEIEFNFGWKVASYAQEWFSFPGVSRRASAPRELDLFSKCCAETLYELINNRGYDNIKYLTFYNEPDYGLNSPTFGDFCVEGFDRKDYWKMMLLSCREAMNKLGLEHIKMWGCEQSGMVETQQDWVDYFKDVKELDCYTSHKYSHISKLHASYENYIKEASAIKPIIITECGQCSGEGYTWNKSHVQFFCDMVGFGASGFLIWVLNGIYLSDPSNFLMRDSFHMWDALQVSNGIDNVRDVYYEWAMLSHYVPNHCKAVKSAVVSGSDDARIAAFKTDKDYTVVVELKGNGCEKDIEIKFDKVINKKFYKHVYRRPVLRNGNAILPPCVAEIEVGDKIAETVNGEYMEIVYTTIPPVPQVALCANELYIKKGESYVLSAEMIDGEGEIAYKLVQSTSKAFSLVGKRICVGEKAKKSDMCAIKAYSIKNPKASAVVIVKVR